MSSGHSAQVDQPSTGKKRRRKRSKNLVGNESSHILETVPVASDVPVSKANKKKKFDIEEHEKTPENLTSAVIDVLNDLETKNSEVSARIDSKKLGATVLTAHVSKPKALKEPNRKKTIYFEDRDNAAEEDNDFDLGKRESKSELLRKSRDLQAVRESLPIYAHREKIMDYVHNNQVTVIIGETGSGKSTQIPQFLMGTNKKRVAVTQPRRVAAASLAARVSEEHGCHLGQEVGYQVRFSNVTSLRTKLIYLTDGMLIREFMLDPTLSKYSTIVIDEAHERTVLTDLILGFLKQLIVRKKRTDMKIIVMSATLNAELFSRFFDHAPVLYVEGKMFPVTKQYLSGSSEDIVDVMIKAIVQVNQSEEEGDILCFLSGQEEIDNCVTILNTLAPELPKEAPLIVPLPLYAALSPSQQLQIFKNFGKRKRKVILATNIAETSITVSGVKYVIDSGLRKVKVWKHQLGLSTLLTTPISQASAKQRAGRAGRESPGKVFRLYSENLFLNKLPKQQESEILRNDITLPILTLKKMGVDDLLNWTWLEHPGQESILSALNSLYALGALDSAGKVTPLGQKMAVLPLTPTLSAVLISASDYGVLQEVIDIVSCLSVENVILNIGGNGELRDEINHKRRQYCPVGVQMGDLISLMEYFNYFQELLAMGSTAELKAWCKELFFSYKGFQNVLKVRKQLTEYMISTIKQDTSLTQHAREAQIRKVKQQLGQGDYSDDEEADRSSRGLWKVEYILKSFLRGYALNTAIGMPDRSYRTCTTGQLISIHPSSNLFGKPGLDAVMYIEYVYTAKAYGRICSQIELSWLQDVAPHLLGGARVAINNE